MGLFDGALGAILGGGAGGLLGGAPAASSTPGAGTQTSGAPDPMLAAALSVMQQHGGLGGLLGTLQQAGLGAQATSWVSTGANQPVSAPQLGAALGPNTIAAFASRIGVPEGQAGAALASILPQLVNHMTPSGQVPDNHGDLLSTALSMLATNRPQR